MADDEVTEDSASESKRRGGMLPMILAAVVALVIGVGGGGAGVWFLLGNDKPAQAGEGDGEASAEGDAAADGEAVAVKPTNEVVDLETFTLNLRDSAGGRKLVMKIALEGQSGVGLLIGDHTAQIRDAIITLASDYTFLEVDGTNGKLRLRDEIHRNVNAILEESGAKVTRVYFTEFVVE